MLTTTQLAYWIILPLLVLAAKASMPAVFMMFRLIAAIVIGYMLISFSYHHLYTQDWMAIGDYQIIHPECQLHACIDEPSPSISDAHMALIKILGWVPALIYVSIWECCWRIWHRRTPLPKSARYFSNSLITGGIITAVIFASTTWGGFLETMLFAIPNQN